MIVDAHLHFELKNPEEIETFRKFSHKNEICYLFSVLNFDFASIISKISDKRFFCFSGIPPFFLDENLQNLEKLIEQNKNLGISEIGLDKNSKFDISHQLEFFSAQLKLAFKYKRPFVLHCVGKWNLMLENLKKFDWEEAKIPFLAHKFYSSREVLNEILRLGGYVSFNEIEFSFNIKKLQELIELTPLDKLFLETDVFFNDEITLKILEAHKIKLKKFYEKIAEIKKIDSYELEKILFENYKIFVDNLKFNAKK